MAEQIFGLLGRKLGHSWSPAIHRELGCENYQLIELEPEALEAFLQREDIGGLNVTIPYKRDVMPFCRQLTPTAFAIGSVNTLVPLPGGGLLGHNTDADGFLWMAKRAGISFRGRKVLVLGSGGASLMAQHMVAIQGAREIVVISRSGPDNYTNLDKHADAEILVNATPVGMYPDVGLSPVDLARFPACKGVLDLIYNPRRTALLLQAEALGIPCSDGLPMLVGQARTAEERFTGLPIEDEENERILALLRRDCTNIVLIGMPGCGKSTVGAALAALTGRELLDMDAEIEKTAGHSIPDIFAEGGESAFRQLEAEAIARLGKLSGKILVTGGGAVKTAENYPALHQNGRIYHLVRDLSLLPREGRPLSQDADLAAMYAERLPLYQRFRDAEVQNCGTPEATAAEIWRDFCAHSGD